MNARRAIEILTIAPGVRYSPQEYEDALAMAREALRYYETVSMAPMLQKMRKDRGGENDKTI